MIGRAEGLNQPGAWGPVFLAGLGLVGLVGIGGCFNDPLRSKEATVIQALSASDRYIHDYVGDEEIGDSCMRGTDYALVTEVDGKPQPVAKLAAVRAEGGSVTGYTVTPSDNPNSDKPPEKTVLHFKVETTGLIPLQPPAEDKATRAVLARYQCSLLY